MNWLTHKSCLNITLRYNRMFCSVIGINFYRDHNNSLLVVMSCVTLLIYGGSNLRNLNDKGLRHWDVSGILMEYSLFLFKGFSRHWTPKSKLVPDKRVLGNSIGRVRLRREMYQFFNYAKSQLALFPLRGFWLICSFFLFKYWFLLNGDKLYILSCNLVSST